VAIWTSRRDASGAPAGPDPITGSARGALQSCAGFPGSGHGGVEIKFVGSICRPIEDQNTLRIEPYRSKSPPPITGQALDSNLSGLDRRVHDIREHRKLFEFIPLRAAAMPQVFRQI